jgi:hypothetical protein
MPGPDEGVKINYAYAKGVPRITLVELKGQRSNEFEEDLSSAIKHLDVID